jgi:hypothetical protein
LRAQHDLKRPQRLRVAKDPGSLHRVSGPFATAVTLIGSVNGSLAVPSTSGSIMRLTTTAIIH